MKTDNQTRARRMDTHLLVTRPVRLKEEAPIVTSTGTCLHHLEERKLNSRKLRSYSSPAACLLAQAVPSRKFSNLPTMMWKLLLEWPEPFHTHTRMAPVSISPATSVPGFQCLSSNMARYRHGFQCQAAAIELKTQIKSGCNRIGVGVRQNPPLGYT